MLNVDAAHDRASVFDLVKGPPPVRHPDRVVVVDDADDLHPWLRGRLGPDGRAAGVVAPAAEAIRLPLTAGLARDVVRVQAFVLASAEGQVSCGGRGRNFVAHWHLRHGSSCFKLL